MCLAIPMRIVEIDGFLAVAEVDGGSLAQPARPSIAHPRVRAMILAGSRAAWGDRFGRDISG